VYLINKSGPEDLKKLGAKLVTFFCGVDHCNRLENGIGRIAVAAFLFSQTVRLSSSFIG